jgi:peptidoglycan/xylan/chitin deacetylase (PgdA/CDA1 family)
MKFVSPLLKQVLYPGLSRVGLFGHDHRDVSVITYHGVMAEDYRRVDTAMDGSILTSSAFRRQLRYLRSKYNVIHPDHVHSFLQGLEALPPRALLITCDDGLLNNLTDMLPILREENVHCLFFVTADSLSQERRLLWYDELYLMMQCCGESAGYRLKGFVGSSSSTTRRSSRELWWELVKAWSSVSSRQRKEYMEVAGERLGVHANWRSEFLRDPVHVRRFGMMTSSELLQLASSGMSIGSHTLSHPMLSQLPAEIAVKEVAESKRLLEEALQMRIWALAYPFGDPESVTSREHQLAAEAGYSCAFLNHEDVQPESHFGIGRFHVTSCTSAPEIDAHLSGFHHSIREFARLPVRLAERKA